MAYGGLLLFARVEHGLPASQGGLNRLCERVRAPEHAPRNASSVLERRYGLAFIVERGAVGVGGAGDDFGRGG